MEYLNSDREIHGSTVNYSDNRDYIPHLHNNIEIIFVQAGTLGAVVNNREYLLSAGDILLVFPFEVHKYLSTPEGGRHYCIAINPVRLSGYGFSAYSVTAGNHLLRANALGDRERSILALLLETHDGNYSSEIRTALTAALFGELLRSCELVPRFTSEGEKSARIISCCMENYTDQAFSLSSLARAVGISSRTLSRFFYNEFGITFLRFITQLRLEKAIELLRNHKTVTEAALDSGFGSLRSFNRNFNLEYHCSPREFLSTWRDPADNTPYLA